MLVTLFGITTLVNEVHFSKAASPILITLSLIDTLVNDSQQSNA